MEQTTEQESISIREALIENRLLKQQLDFLERQLEIAQTFQAKMGFTLNKITIEELFDKKIIDIIANERTSSTVESYKQSKYYFLKWTTKKRGLKYADEVTTDHTNEFWTWFKITPGINGKIIGRARRINLWSCMKCTFQFAEDRNSVTKNPFKFKNQVLKPVTEYWTDEYTKELIKAVKKYARPSVKHRYETVIRLLKTTGIRIGKLFGIKFSDVIIKKEGRVFIRTSLKIPKTAKVQEIITEITNEKAKEMFLFYYNARRNKKYVLCTKYAEKSKGSECSFRNSMRDNICPKANLGYISPHGGKHGFVTKLLENGLSSVQVCAVTGNKTPHLIETLYNHVIVEPFKDKIKEIMNRTD